SRPSRLPLQSRWHRPTTRYRLHHHPRASWWCSPCRPRDLSHPTNSLDLVAFVLNDVLQGLDQWIIIVQFRDIERDLHIGGSAARGLKPLRVVDEVAFLQTGAAAVPSHVCYSPRVIHA